jgi:hypothetical protein
VIVAAFAGVESNPSNRPMLDAAIAMGLKTLFIIFLLVNSSVESYRCNRNKLASHFIYFTILMGGVAQDA